VLNIAHLRQQQLADEPYRWGLIDQLFTSRDGWQLAETYPRDHFKTMIGYDSEKEWHYEVRSLIGMGATLATDADHLHWAWQMLANDLLSAEYRAAISHVTGLDLSVAPMEVNAFHYGAGSWQGPHKDLPAKRVTHVLYFNEDWRAADGGHLRILRSQAMDDIHTTVSPEVGNSSLFVRSDHSWHAVEPVAAGCTRTRRSVVVTFYHPDSPSTMWPVGESPELHDYPPADSSAAASWWRRIFT
jgi:SM-20-related protein